MDNVVKGRHAAARSVEKHDPVHTAVGVDYSEVLLCWSAVRFEWLQLTFAGFLCWTSEILANEETKHSLCMCAFPCVHLVDVY